MNKPQRLLSIVALTLSCHYASGKITLPAFITDSMVVQQADRLTLTGHAYGFVEEISRRQ